MTKVLDLLRDKGADVYGIGPDEPVLAAVQMMAERSIGAVLVLRDGRLEGIVSERDYARKVVLKGRSSAETAVWEIMSSPVVTVGPQDSVNTCMKLMTEKRIRHLPVVEQGAVIGVLSIGDLVKHVIEEQEREIAQLQRYIAS
jgi:CBS domain-containing protein